MNVGASVTIVGEEVVLALVKQHKEDDEKCKREKTKK